MIAKIFPIIIISVLKLALNKKTSRLFSLNNHGMRIVTWNMAKNSNSQINALKSTIAVYEADKFPLVGKPVKNVYRTAMIKNKFIKKVGINDPKKKILFDRSYSKELKAKDSRYILKQFLYKKHFRL